MLNLLLGSIIVSAIPQELNWADFEGKNLLTMARSQTTPNYCEAGWAFSATSALNDRIKIKRDGAWQDVILSPQVLLSCDWYSRGCKGGSPYSAYRYIYRNEITDETCSVYEARGRTNGLGCSELEICKTCEPGAGCETPESYWVYPITDYGSVKGEKQIISELQNGPIACEVKVSEDFRNFQGGRIIQDKEFDGDLQHSVSITGYGTENGVDYWHVRNSWGIWWGDQGGFFKIARGSNLMQIEDNCAWATPGDAYLKTTKKISPPKSNPERIYYNDLLAQDTTPVKITKALPHEKYTLDSFPTQIDWRNHNGQNYASWTRNHHSPTYCGGCWVHGTSSSIADRVNIFRNNTFPTISVSSQATINCFGGGSCHGGLPIGMYFYAHHHGAVDDTCQQYVAVEPESFACTAINECKICDPPVPGNNDSSQCRAVENIPRYYIDNYGHARGVHEMKGQIYEYGPISCFMATTPEFYAYTGGIFSQKQTFHLFDHVVSIVGWGVSEEGVEYWIGRNSWGTFWGDQGWFKIQMHKDNLGIEDWCSWGIPTAEKPEDQGQFSKVL